jgi:hypothetical protein
MIGAYRRGLVNDRDRASDVDVDGRARVRSSGRERLLLHHAATWRTRGGGR